MELDAPLPPSAAHALLVTIMADGITCTQFCDVIAM